MIDESESLCILPPPSLTHTNLEVLALPASPAAFTLLELSPIGSVTVKGLPFLHHKQCLP